MAANPSLKLVNLLCADLFVFHLGQRTPSDPVSRRTDRAARCGMKHHVRWVVTPARVQHKTTWMRDHPVRVFPVCGGIFSISVPSRLWLGSLSFSVFPDKPPGAKRRIKVRISVPRGHGQIVLCPRACPRNRRMPMEIAKRISKLGWLE